MRQKLENKFERNRLKEIKLGTSMFRTRQKHFDENKWEKFRKWPKHFEENQ